MNLRMSFGAVGPTIVKSKDIENEIKNLTIDKIINNVDNFRAEYSKIINPIDDQRSTAAYRKRVCLNLVCDFLKSLSKNSSDRYKW